MKPERGITREQQDANELFLENVEWLMETENYSLKQLTRRLKVSARFIEKTCYTSERRDILDKLFENKVKQGRG